MALLRSKNVEVFGQCEITGVSRTDSEEAWDVD